MLSTKNPLYLNHRLGRYSITQLKRRSSFAGISSLSSCSSLILRCPLAFTFVVALSIFLHHLHLHSSSVGHSLSLFDYHLRLFS
mmetsp:Transcript_13999/g.21771  ORF Transcript_13999/g.21771 Transcript_13999/m.21771 type:complete len:84 (+) Transcript_13999:853-1104(+)